MKVYKYTRTAEKHVDMCDGEKQEVRVTHLQTGQDNAVYSPFDFFTLGLSLFFGVFFFVFLFLFFRY